MFEEDLSSFINFMRREEIWGRLVDGLEMCVFMFRIIKIRMQYFYFNYIHNVSQCFSISFAIIPPYKDNIIQVIRPCRGVPESEHCEQY